MSFLSDLEAAAAELSRLNPQKTKRHNPRPPGVPRPGSASACVVEYLRSITGLRTKAQVVIGVNQVRKAAEQEPLSGKAIDWALLYLRNQDLIQAVGDGARNPRYLRYRAAPMKGDDHE